MDESQKGEPEKLNRGKIFFDRKWEDLWKEMGRLVEDLWKGVSFISNQHLSFIVDTKIILGVEVLISFYKKTQSDIIKGQNREETATTVHDLTTTVIAPHMLSTS